MGKPHGEQTQELTRIQMLAAIGVLACIADDELKAELRIAAKIGSLTEKAIRAQNAKKWLMEKLEKLDISRLPL